MPIAVQTCRKFLQPNRLERWSNRMPSIHRMWFLTFIRQSSRVLLLFLTQTHSSEQFKVRRTLTTQMHWPIEHC